MSANYGTSTVNGLIESGDFDEALELATKLLESAGESAEGYFDRGRAYDGLERYAESVTDFERAIEHNIVTKSVESFALDDAYFSALLGAAKAASKADSAALLGRYAARFPHGSHLSDVESWSKRLSGALPSLLDRTIEIGKDV